MRHAPPHTAPIQAGLDHLDQGVCIFDADLRLVAWNRRFVELLGFPAGLVAAGARFADLVRDLGARGELGPVDVEEVVARREVAARSCARFYTERTTLAGRVIAA